MLFATEEDIQLLPDYVDRDTYIIDELMHPRVPKIGLRRRSPGKQRRGRVTPQSFRGYAWHRIDSDPDSPTYGD